MNVLLVTLHILLVLFLIPTYLRVMQIRTRSRFIIAQSDVKYHFEIINGPSAEEILCQNQYEWSRNFGFEIIPHSEPYRMHSCHKETIKRRVLSYFIVPDSLNDIHDKETKQMFYAVSYNKSGSENMTKEINSFLQKDVKELVISASLSKEARSNAYAYFGGGITASYGTRYDLNISYNLDTRSGSMTIMETR
jgi:hypothetical protein